MSYLRAVGNNITLEMKKKNISISSLSEQVGLDRQDLVRIIEGRLVVFPDILRIIADALGVSVEKLEQPRESSQYDELVHCMGCFTKPENKDKILDYIDFYIGIQEAK